MHLMTNALMTETAFTLKQIAHLLPYIRSFLCVRFLLRKYLVRRSAASFPQVLTHCWKMLSTKT